VLSCYAKGLALPFGGAVTIAKLLQPIVDDLAKGIQHPNKTFIFCQATFILPCAS